MFRCLHFSFFASFLASTTLLSAQDSSWVNLQIDTLATGIKLCSWDRLGNSYAVDAGNRLLKFDNQGKRQSTLNYSYSGSLGWLDATNPLELLLFYPEMNSIAIVDNNLALKGQIDLSSLDISQASAVGRAYDNGFWVFDLGTMKLKKLGRDGKLSLESGNLLQISGGLSVYPQLILDNGERVVLVDKENGFFVFDVFGQFIKRVPLNGIIWAEIGREGVSFLTEKEMGWYDFQSLERRYSPILAPELKAFKLQADGLRIFLSGNILLLGRPKK